MFFKYYVCEDVNDEDTEFILNSIIEITTIMGNKITPCNIQEALNESILSDIKDKNFFKLFLLMLSIVFTSCFSLSQSI